MEYERVLMSNGRIVYRQEQERLAVWSEEKVREQIRDFFDGEQQVTDADIRDFWNRKAQWLDEQQAKGPLWAAWAGECYELAERIWQEMTAHTTKAQPITREQVREKLTAMLDEKVKKTAEDAGLFGAELFGSGTNGHEPEPDLFGADLPTKTTELFGS